MKLTWLALAVFGLIAAPANAQSQMSDFSSANCKSIYEELDAMVQDEARSSTDTPYLDGEKSARACSSRLSVSNAKRRARNAAGA